MENTPIRILLADDDEADRLLFQEAFKEMKIKTIVETVSDGVELMEYLAKKNRPQPHLLFLDLSMPRKNGLECLLEIRSNEVFKDLTVAIYSTSASEKDIEETYLNGANVYINKPNDFATLKQVLEKALKVTYMYQYPPFNKELFLMRV